MHILRCNQCHFEVPAWQKNERGEPINGWAILRAHVKRDHPAYLAALKASLLRWPDTLCWLVIASSIVYGLAEIVRAAE